MTRFPSNTRHWANVVCDAGPTLNQHWFNVSCLLCCDDLRDMTEGYERTGCHPGLSEGCYHWAIWYPQPHLNTWTRLMTREHPPWAGDNGAPVTRCYGNAHHLLTPRACYEPPLSSTRFNHLMDVRCHDLVIWWLLRVMFESLGDCLLSCINPWSAEFFLYKPWRSKGVCNMKSS